MIREIQIYIEGGGDDKDSLGRLRVGFESFFREVSQDANGRGVHLKIITSGGRDSAFKDFRIASQLKEPSSIVLLLVDSESALKDANPWRHFEIEGKDDWDCTKLDPDLCHLMVQAMEAWFFADADKLAEFYGVGFLADALQCDNVETISKYNLKNYLRNATQDTNHGRYRKMQHGPLLLGLIRPSIVREKASYCKRLFSTLNELIQN